MAVFTEIFNAQLDELLSHYDIGQARSLKGIASGIENSNFYLDTDKGKYVLTIFERLNKDQLPYYLELTSHLGKKGLAVSYPISRKDFGLAGRLCGGRTCRMCGAGGIESPDVQSGHKKEPCVAARLFFMCSAAGSGFSLDQSEADEHFPEILP